MSARWILVRLSVCVWCVFGVAAASASEPLIPSISQWAVFASGAGAQFRMDQGVGSLGTSGTAVSPLGSFVRSEAVAYTEGFGGIAESFATALAASAPTGLRFEDWGGIAQAETSYYFYMNVRDLIPAPSDIHSTPIHASGTSFADVSASGISRAIAHAYAVVGGVHTSQVAADSGRPRDPQTVKRRWEYDFFAETDAPVLVELHSYAHATGGAGFTIPSGQATAHSYADPTFEFNQQAFDAFALAQGFPTFQLSDYFAIEFSPLHPVAPPASVPEPSTAALSILGGALLVRSRRTRG